MGSERDERRKLRPYRLLVRIVFWVALLAFITFVLRGIIRHLDRMPSVDQYDRLASVDTRALRACGDDLGRMITDLHRLRARLATDPDADEDVERWEELEARRLAIVARCHLDQPGSDPAEIELAAAADTIEKLIGLTAVHEARFQKEVAPYAEEAAAELERSAAILRSR